MASKQRQARSLTVREWHDLIAAARADERRSADQLLAETQRAHAYAFKRLASVTRTLLDATTAFKQVLDEIAPSGT